MRPARKLDIGDSIPQGTISQATPHRQIPNRDLVGKSLVIFFYLRPSSPTCRAEACGFRDLYQQFRDLGAEVLAIGPDSPADQCRFADEHQLPFQLYSDPQLRIADAFGLAGVHSIQGDEAQIALRRGTFIASPNLRVLKLYDRIEDPKTHPFQVLEDARQLLRSEEPRLMHQHAPVLLVPDVLPPTVCQHLISVWETQGNEDSGFMKQIDGKTVGLMDYSHKIRRDHFVDKETDTDKLIKRYVVDRVIPEIKKASNFDVTRYEDFRIACYDAGRGGYFRPHRDNTTEGTAHRRFAMSLLLNDDYEGGQLRFAEYGPHLYRPPMGSAVIFSCSLVHEALDVTAGRRFVLLSFFYGNKEAKLREEYAKKVGGEYRA